MSRLEEQPTEIISPAEVAESNGKPETPSSLIGQLREMRAQKAKDKFYDLDVPGYNSCLVVRLNPLGSSVIAKLRQRAERSSSPDVDLNANSDVIITGCREVLGRTSPDLELGPLDPEADGPIRIDETLAELLKLGTTTARQSLLALWDKANAPEIAIGLAAAAYVEWSGETQEELDEEFVGKT